VAWKQEVLAWSPIDVYNAKKITYRTHPCRILLIKSDAEAYSYLRNAQECAVFTPSQFSELKDFQIFKKNYDRLQNSKSNDVFPKLSFPFLPLLTYSYLSP
jgi:hypothetical protein